MDFESLKIQNIFFKLELKYPQNIFYKSKLNLSSSEKKFTFLLSTYMLKKIIYERPTFCNKR